MIKQLLYTGVILLVMSGSLGANIATEITLDAQLILDQLYKSFGDKRIECPVLEVSDTEEFVAKYSPGSHKIVIENKAIILCQDYGQYGDDALAFIIGHELAHAFQEHLDHTEETSFLAYNKVYSSSTRAKIDVKKKEGEADVFGCFGAYLAGYEIHKVFPELINGIYSTYGLNDKMLPQYPTKSVRNKSAKTMISKLDSLVHLYDLANYLSLTGHYLEASVCYDRVNRSYNGLELTNNKGVNNLLEALNLGKLNAEPYYYPIEIDLDSRLHKAKKTAATKDLSPGEQMLFELLIVDAIQAFRDCTIMDPNYLPAYLNTICAYAINNQADKALKFIKEKGIEEKVYRNGDADTRASYEIAKSICLLKSGKKDDGEKLLRALRSTSNENIVLLASINLDGGGGQDQVSESGPAGSSSSLMNKYKRSKPSMSNYQLLDSSKDISYTSWTKSSRNYYHVMSKNKEILVVKSSESLGQEVLGKPKFINKELQVFNDHGLSKITFEADDSEVLIMSN